MVATGNPITLKSANIRPVLLCKNELRAAAVRELNVSKNSFDFAWIDAIERAGRHDWHNPLRRRSC